MLRLLVIFGLLAGLPASATADLSPEAARGKAVMTRAQCNRCHDVSDVSGQGRGLDAADRAVHCVDCHTWILGTKGDQAAIEAQLRVFPDWERYLETIVHLTRLPDLGTLTRRVDPAFIRHFLDAPIDLRPHLEESMIPLRLSAKDKDAVVAYLTALNGAEAVRKGQARGPVSLSAERVAAGRAKFLALGCPTCHLLGNAKLVPGFDRNFYGALGDAGLLAPNLRHVGRRIPRDRLVAFILDPKKIDPRTAMAPISMKRADAESIADFLLGFVPPTKKAPAPLRDVPLLGREVLYDEVFDEILGKICVHCHMNPASNNGDGGAGNTGGLGYVGVSLDLETYAGLKRGLVRNGERVSVLEPAAPGEAPLLLEALYRRHREAARDQRPPFQDYTGAGPRIDPLRPGMPLGLPALDVEQLRLIKTWLAAGAPGPRGP